MTNVYLLPLYAIECFIPYCYGGGDHGKITLVFSSLVVLSCSCSFPENDGSLLAICYVTFLIHFFLVTIWKIILILFHVAKYLDI